MKKVFKISFVGDIMCKQKQLEVSKKNGKYDFKECFKNIQKYFSKSDYIVGNLETPITENNNNLTEEMFSFSTPIEFVKELKEIGFNLFSNANNHCLDRGKNGLIETINCLNKLNISHIGTYKNKDDRENTFIINNNGLRISFLSYTYGTNANINGVYLKNKEKYMVNLLKKQEIQIKKWNILRRFKRRYLKKYIQDSFNYNKDKEYLSRVVEDIKKARENSDFIFFCMHSGGQYNEYPEEYTKKLVDFLIENGVDYVIGAHPHVVHGIKKFKKKLGAYSIGNFYATPFANPAQKDELADYSIIMNFYFNIENKTLDKITYSIAKSEMDNDGYTRVFLAKDLYKNIKLESRKEKILQDTLTIARTFSGKEENELLEEYILSRCVNE